MQRFSYGIDWLQKGIWYGPTKLDNRPSQNEYNSRRSQSLSRKLWKTGEWNWQKEKKIFVQVKFQGGIFQGGALSLLLSVIVMMPLNNIRKKWIEGYKLHKSQKKINHQIYIDDIKQFAKSEKNWKP